MNEFDKKYNLISTQYVLKNYHLSYDMIKNINPSLLSIEDQKKYYYLLIQILIELHYKYESYQICENIIFSQNFDWCFKNDFINFQSKFIMILTDNINKKIKLNCPTSYKYKISSISILSKGEEYQCNFRAINYDYTKNGDYISRDEDYIIRTKNYISDINQNFDIQSMWEVKDPINFHTFPSHILGMEDIRLFGDSYFLCTRLDATECHRPKICLGIYNNKRVDSMYVLNYGQMKTEKNWLPCYKNKNDCKIIYSFDPLIIYTLNLENGQLEPFINKKITLDNLETFRGSAVPINYKNGWLMTIHQVYYNKLRKYLHRFVWIDENFNTIKFSKNFCFEKIGVEFNLGICHSPNGLIITYSVDDDNPTLIILDYNILDMLLNFD